TRSMPAFTSAELRRLCAPAIRFSSTVRFSKTRRPSKTCTTPRLTTSNGNSRSSRAPSSSTLPLVTSPRSVCKRPEIAFSVVVLLGRRDRQRRHQSAQIELLDALEALLDVLAFGRFTAGLLQRVLQRLDMDRRLQETPVIDHGVVHLLRRLLAVLFVHRLDFL